MRISLLLSTLVVVAGLAVAQDMPAQQAAPTTPPAASAPAKPAKHKKHKKHADAKAPAPQAAPAATGSAPAGH